eukprot:TRINITY_DN14638_c0_g1_i1.p2 TRINITY_DN14638_c0_g1~~TRINITY_DN14638_c0_g1_i1.p2  ORF type:complete len:245 (+),score=39.90 TRINITY_DN14638_c0_g1_i1:697-1431(+)
MPSTPRSMPSTTNSRKQTRKESPKSLFLRAEKRRTLSTLASMVNHFQPHAVSIKESFQCTHVLNEVGKEMEIAAKENLTPSKYIFNSLNSLETACFSHSAQFSVLLRLVIDNAKSWGARRLFYWVADHSVELSRERSQEWSVWLYQIYYRIVGLGEDKYDLQRTERHIKGIEEAFSKIEEQVIDKKADLTQLKEFNELREKFFKLDAKNEAQIKSFVEDFNNNRRKDYVRASLLRAFPKQFMRS